MDQCSPARHPTSTTGPLTKPPGHDLVIDLRPCARGLQSAHRQPARTTACRKACYCSPIRHKAVEPPWGIEPQTYALRDSAVADGCRRLVSFNAGSLPHCPWLVGAGYGWRRMGGGISGADECGSGGAASSETSQLRPVLATWQQAPSSGGRTMCPFEGYTPLCDAVGGCGRRRREPLRRQMRPVSWAHMATSTRFRAPSFRMRLARWALTVLGVM
jgi:hypothetical protein